MAPDRVEVFVPAHVTGLFTVHRRSDPARTGSRGAGLTLTDGVHVAVERSPHTAVILDGREISIEAVTHVMDATDLDATVTVRSDVPLGAGFGVSGAMALGTAFGLDAVAGTGRTANALAKRAHVADVEAGTGLGDVVAQLRGGAPIRLEPGAPGYGATDGLAVNAEIEYLTLGDLSTQNVLAGSHEQLNRAGDEALRRLLERPTLETLFSESARFARASGLLTEDVAEVVDAVEDAGGTASMAMLGRTVFALGPALTEAGYDAERCAIDQGGVRVTSDVRVY